MYHVKSQSHCGGFLWWLCTVWRTILDRLESPAEPYSSAVNLGRNVATPWPAAEGHGSFKLFKTSVVDHQASVRFLIPYRCRVDTAPCHIGTILHCVPHCPSPYPIPLPSATFRGLLLCVCWGGEYIFL